MMGRHAWCLCTGPLHYNFKSSLSTPARLTGNPTIILFFKNLSFCYCPDLGGKLCAWLLQTTSIESSLTCKPVLVATCPMHVLNLPALCREYSIPPIMKDEFLCNFWKDFCFITIQVQKVLRFKVYRGSSFLDKSLLVLGWEYFLIWEARAPDSLRVFTPNPSPFRTIYKHFRERCGPTEGNKLGSNIDKIERIWRENKEEKSIGKTKRVSERFKPESLGGLPLSCHIDPL